MKLDYTEERMEILQGIINKQIELGVKKSMSSTAVKTYFDGEYCVEVFGECFYDERYSKAIDKAIQKLNDDKEYQEALKEEVENVIF